MMQLTKKVYHFFFTAVFLLLSQVNYAQFDIPAKPSRSEQTLVYDYANLLDGGQRKQLERKLIDYSNETSTQILVIVIPSLQGENIGLLGPRWGHEWGVGQKGKDNGVVILMAVKDRQIGIYPGYGAEEKITAGQGGNLIRSRVIPNFKAGDYYGGINEAVDGVSEMLLGTYTNDNPTRLEGDNEVGGLGCLFLIIIIIFLTIIFSKNNGGGNGGGGGGRGKRSFGSDLADIIILSNMGRRSGGSNWGGGFGGGGSFGGGGGGGFGGFGGGGFSGGGSSGSW